MTFTPILPTGGNAGWAFLQRTREKQQTAFENSGQMLRDVEYFRENISKVKRVDDLMKDHRLLKVSLGAFGLDEKIDAKFFIKKVLEEGTVAEDSFANRLTDKRFHALSEAFGFDMPFLSTELPDFADRIIGAYQERQFEVAVGERDPNMRRALGFERDLSGIVENAKSVDGMWYQIMANKPVREVFDGAFNLPTAFGALDVDRQLEIYKQKAEAFFGTSNPRDFTDPGKQKEVIRRFLVQADLQSQATGTSSGSVALSLLQAGGNVGGYNPSGLLQTIQLGYR